MFENVGIDTLLDASVSGVVIDCDDKVWPMVAPGTPISECFDEKDMR